MKDHFLIVNLILLIVITSFGYANENTKEDVQKFQIIIDTDSKFSIDRAGDSEILSGSYNGDVTGLKLLEGMKANCNLVGRSYQGRGFSCGFAEVEELNGICIFAKNKNDVIIAKWQCITSVGDNGDASCLGKASFVEGHGLFAGIDGSASISSPLVKQLLEKKISLPSVWKANISLPDKL